MQASFIVTIFPSLTDGSRDLRNAGRRRFTKLRQLVEALESVRNQLDVVNGQVRHDSAVHVVVQHVAQRLVVARDATQFGEKLQTCARP